MTRLWRPWIAGWLAAFVCCLAAHAGETPPPAKLLREALHAESFGLSEQGIQIRNEALATAPDSPLVRSYLGKVRYGNAWLPIDEAAKHYAKSERLAAYERRRADARDNAASQISLATWCRREGLFEQEQAHLLRALDFDPEQKRLRQRLGQVRSGLNWLSADEADQQKQWEQQQAIHRQQWQPLVDSIVRRLSGVAEERREAALELDQIRDPGAILTLEEALISATDELAAPLATTLGRIDEPEAAEALAGVVVRSSQPAARTEAARQLASRDRYSYVPQLLANLHTMLTMRGTTRVSTAKNRVIFNQEYVRQAVDRDETFSVQTLLKRRSTLHGGGVLSIDAARPHLKQEEAQRRSEVEQENQKIAAKNAQIIDALNLATGQQLGDSPQAWWDWWNRETESLNVGSRARAVFKRTSYVSIDDQDRLEVPLITVTASSSTSEYHLPRVQARYDCFVAGTPVCTARGMQPIERLTVGDLVLSQNVATGELEYKAIVRATRRPPIPLVKLVVGNEVLECTGGHLFWVVERGWVKARDLKPGLVVHGAMGTASVTSNEAGPTAPTFDLVVADHHNYFAGTTRCLTHDNTSPRARSLIAPGVDADDE